MGRNKWAVIVFAFLMLLPASCGKVEQEPVQITVIHGWGSTEKDHVAMRKIYSDFQKENPDVLLQIVSMPTNGEMRRKVEDRIMVGEIPDVIFLGGVGRDNIYSFMMENDLALDLMPYLETDKELKASIAPANLEYWLTEDKKLFTISDVLLLSGGYWYNEDIFRQAGIRQPPKTWEEFEQVCRTVENWAEKEQNEVQPLQVPAEGYLYFLDHFMAVNGGAGERAVRQRKMTLHVPETEAILDRLADIYAYSIADGQEYSYRDETDMFNDGKLAMYLNGVWGASMIADEVNARYALLPGGDGVTLSCESACLGYMLSNSGSEKKQEASIRFLKYMLSDRVQKRILVETEQMPANPGIPIEDYKEEMMRFYQAVETVQSAEVKIEVPDNLWDNYHKGIFEKNILDVLSGKMSKKDFIDLLKGM